MCSSRPPRMALIWESTSTKGHLWQSLDRSKAGVSEGCTISPARVPVGCSHLLRYQAVSSSLTGRNLVLSFFFFWPCFVAYELLVPQPGMEPRPPALGGQSLSQWATSEIPVARFWSWNQEPSQALSDLSHLPSFPYISVLPQSTSTLGSYWSCAPSDSSLCLCCHFGLQFTHILLSASWIPTASVEPKSVSILKLPLILHLSMSVLMHSEWLPNLGFARSSIRVLTTLW